MLFILLAWPAATPGAATFSILDEFDGPAAGQTVSIVDASLGESAEDVASGTGAVGDTRQILLRVFETPGGSSLLQATVNGSGTPGTLDVSQSAGIRSRTTIVYDAGGAGLDLDLAGLVSFTVEGVSVDQDTLLSFTTHAPAFGGGMVSSGRSVSLPAGFSGDVTVDGSFFAGDLGQVFRVQLDVLFSTAGGDLEADRFVAIIPEPSTALLVGLGLVGLGATRRPRSGAGDRLHGGQQTPRARSRRSARRLRALRG